MPDMPFAITGGTLDEITRQTNELFRILFEEKIGGYDREYLSANRMLSLNSSKDVISTEVSGYADGIIGNVNIIVTDNGDGTVSLSFTPTMASWVAGTANQITVTNDGDGTITLSAPQDLHTGASPTFADAIIAGLSISDFEGLIYYSGGQ